MAKKDNALVRREEMGTISPFAEMERYFDEMFRNPFALLNSPLMTRTGAGAQVLSPSVDIYEEDGKVVVKAEVPGVDRDDLDVTITDDTLTISGEKKQESKVEKKNYHRVERRYGSFRRSFRLPEGVNGNKAKASFKDGVLEIRIPRAKESKQKKIEIS